MPKKTTKSTLDGLIAAREHIVSKWVRGSWFVYIDEHDKKQGEDNVPAGQPVVGVCAAGSVLYALDYTDERWMSQKDVKPVIEALYDAIPARSRAARKSAQEMADTLDATFNDEEVREKQIYDNKVGAIIDYNDSKGRRKQDVVAWFDRAIENTRAATPLTIQELAL